MKRQFTFGKITYYLLCLIVSISFIAANRVRVKRYSLYQMKVWELKAREGYVSWWKPDGMVYNRKLKKRVQSYSIGFGYNDQGTSARRKAIAKYTRDRKVSYSEAMTISMSLDVWNRKYHNDPLTNLAMQLYAYNRGTITSPSQLGRCCGGKNGCGHPRRNVRRSHNPRREFELALKRHDWIAIQAHVEENQKKAALNDRMYK